MVTGVNSREKERAIREDEAIRKWVSYFEALPKLTLSKKLKVATFFSGIGAVEQAFHRLKVDFEVTCACDIDKYAKKSYLANYRIEEGIGTMTSSLSCKKSRTLKRICSLEVVHVNHFQV